MTTFVDTSAWLELMDERGSGVRRMRQAMELAGQLPPRFLEERGGVTIEVEAATAADTTVPMGGEEAVPVAEHAPLTDSVTAILAIVDELGQVTTASCVQKLGIPRVTAWRTLSRLVEEGLLEARGAGRGTKYRRKRRNEHG
jgi:predicted HTH transcriptional regulator